MGDDRSIFEAVVTTPLKLVPAGAPVARLGRPLYAVHVLPGLGRALQLAGRAIATNRQSARVDRCWWYNPSRTVPTDLAAPSCERRDSFGRPIQR